MEDILGLEEQLIVNCTSFGSEKLFNDSEFIPTRGHLLVFNNVNYLEYMVFENIRDSKHGAWITLYPFGDELLVCGMYEKGVNDPHVDPEIVDYLLAMACAQFDPESLKLYEESDLQEAG